MFLLRGLKQQAAIDLLVEKQNVITKEVEDKVKKLEPEFEKAAIRQTAAKFDVVIKNIPEGQMGGKIEYTGLMKVHGGAAEGGPEVMFDNVQMNRLEALLTLGERDRGGGGSNDFSTQNMDNRRITSTVTNIAAPQKHLFGVQEQRFGIA